MRLPDPAPRPRLETLLPLIDVVFFLLIAFMMISHLAQARPFAVTLPDSPLPGSEAGRFTLFVSADGMPGVMAPAAVTGEAALAVLQDALRDHCARSDCAGSPPDLRVQADAAMPGPELARLLPRLSAMGFGALHLGTVGP